MVKIIKMAKKVLQVLQVLQVLHFFKLRGASISWQPDGAGGVCDKKWVKSGKWQKRSCRSCVFSNLGGLSYSLAG